MTDLLKTIQEAWGWCGGAPAEIIATNAFGNVIFQDSAGHIWRIRPEELSVTLIASSRLEFEAARATSGFATDWNMEALRVEAEALFGEPGDGRCYCFKTPPVLGGQYAADNLGTIALGEFLGSSGTLAFQIKDVPDHSQITLVIKKSN